MEPKKLPLINPNTCLTCRACVGICPRGAISQLRREVEIDHALCNGCGACVSWCPAKAISFGAGTPHNKIILKKTAAPAHLKKHYDLIIVGAGIAGLSTATAALQQNPKLRLLVLEKKRKVGEDVNSSAGVWYPMLDLLPLTPEERSQVVLGEFTKLGAAAEKESTYLDMQKPFSAAIDLSRLLSILSEKTIQLGGQVETNSFVGQLERNEAGFSAEVISKGRSYLLKTTLLADASGIDASAWRRLGLFKSWQPETIGVGAEYEMTWTGDQSTGWIIGLDYRNLGYGWSFPIGNGKSRVGVGSRLGAFKNNNIPIQEELDEFVRTHPIIKKNTGTKASRTNFKCGAYPMWELSDKVICDNALRVGDSASQANPLLGEGIYHAVKYGQKAGEVLAKCREGKGRELKEYEAYVLKDRKNFEHDKGGLDFDYTTLIKRLKKARETLSEREKTAILGFFMPFDVKWTETLKVAIKIVGYGGAIKIIKGRLKKEAGRLF